MKQDYIVYAVLNKEKEIVSKLYSRKGDAKRERNRCSWKKEFTIGTFKVVLTKEDTD